MLKSFTVSGFRKFNKPITLDLSNIGYYEFNGNCIRHGIVREGIIFGMNSSGKTNFGRALSDIVITLFDPVGKYEDNGYFLNTRCDEAFFEYAFIFDEKEVIYAYSKNTNEEIIYETLKIDNKCIFEIGNRDPMAGDKKSDLTGLKELAPTLNFGNAPQGALLRFFNNNSAIDSSHPIRKLFEFVKKMLFIHGKTYVGTIKVNDFRSFIEDQKLLEKFREMLAKANVNDVLDWQQIEQNVTITRDKFKENHIITNLPIINMNANIRQEALTLNGADFFKVSSSGTQALYSVFYWLNKISDYSLIFIDEFDSYYHFALAEYIVKMLQTDTNAQVLLTSHNTNLMTNRFMRPDCCFVISEEGIKSFRDATEMEIREGHNLERLYQGGAFGG